MTLLQGGLTAAVIFRWRCPLCHGRAGRGRSKMKKAISGWRDGRRRHWLFAVPAAGSTRGELRSYRRRSKTALRGSTCGESSWL